MKYRSDIDGLRAIAVGAVLLFHARLLGVTGGFVGVDIFFVISGYLITRILQGDADNNRFSILQFYDRRIRRILPAYILVIIVSTLAAYAILPPAEMSDYGRRLTSTALFVSNFYFRLQTDYFARASGDNPLLHTWSLSVEEQFYIVWPLIIFALSHGKLARWRRPVVLVLFSGSLALACYAAVTRPLAAFFYSPLRAWELLLGAIIALGMVPHLSRKGNEIAAIAGLVLMAVPIFFYTSASTIFPGAAAIPPCLGAALILLAGRDGQTMVGRLLSLKPLLFTGLISYSLYLWHWPVLVFSRLYLGRELQPLEVGVALAGSYLLAALSWRFIERPFRKHHTERSGTPHSVPVAVAILAMLAIVGMGIDRSKGIPGRSNPQAASAEAQIAVPKRASNCFVDPVSGAMPKTKGCLLGPGGEKDVKAVLLGDSHAADYTVAMDRLGRSMGFTARQWTKGSCTPLLADAEANFQGKFLLSRGPKSCQQYLRNALDILRSDRNIEVVVVAGFWSSQQDDAQANYERRPAGPAAQTRLQAGLENMVRELRATGKKVILLGQTPIFPSGGGDCVVRQKFLNRDAQAVCGTSITYARDLLGPSDELLVKLAKHYSGVSAFLASHEFCGEKYCSPLMDEQLVVRDEHHLTEWAALNLAGKMRPVLKRAGL